MTDVFDQGTQTPPTNVAPVNSNLFEDKLKGIVNDQGVPKYKDVNAALDALNASQEHIKRLEDEAKTSKSVIDNAIAEKARADALEEIVKRYTQNSGNPSTVATATKEVPSEEAIVNQLETIISKREAIASAQKNVSTVTSALIAKFGDEAKTKEAVAAKAKELGMTPQRLGALSGESPNAVLSWFGLTASNSSASPTSPSSTPLNQPKDTSELKRPEQSLLSGPGATDANRRALMKQIKDDVYKKLGVET